MFWSGRAAILVLLLTTAGCLSPRGDSLPVHTYQLSLDAEAEATSPAAPDGPVLLISLPQAEPGFESQRMAYVTRRYELEYYAANQWAESPARLLSPLLILAASRTGAWRAVVALPGTIRGDYRLDSTNVAVQQEFLQKPSLVRVTMRGQLVALKESRVVSTRTFEAVAPASSEDAYGGVLAANQATAAVVTQVSAWLQSCVRHQPECNQLASGLP